MLDQSASMSERWTDRGESKAAFAARALNSAIQDMPNRNADGEQPRNRFELVVIGYSFSASVLLHVVPEQTPYRIEAQAKSNANMLEAFYLAKKIIVRHKEEYPHAAAPTVLNISGGQPGNIGGCKAVKQFVYNELWPIHAGGNPLLTFNIGIDIDARSRQAIAYPADISEVPGDEYSEFMVEISSVIPESLRAVAAACGIAQLKRGARGCVIGNPSVDVLTRFIRFGSTLHTGIRKGNEISCVPQ
jgi:hypothetical protein